MSKRRRIREKKGSKKKEFDLVKFLKELKGYKRLSSRRNFSPDEMSIVEIRKLVKKETKKKLKKLLEKYFNKILDSVKRGKRKYSYMQNEVLAVSEASQGDLVETLMTFVTREIEKKNVEDLGHTDHRFFELCGITIPRDVMMEIFKYLHCDYNLIKSFGCTNSSFYLLILTNWNSKVKIDNPEQLQKISLLVLQSLRHLSINIARNLWYSDWEYLLNNITPNRIESFEILNEVKSKKKSDYDEGNQDDDVKLHRLHNFFQSAFEKDIVFSRCKELTLSTNLLQVMSREIRVEDEDGDDLNVDCSRHFVTLMPNVENLNYPFHLDGDTSSHSFGHCFKKLSKVRKIRIVNEKQIFGWNRKKEPTGSQKFLNICHSPEKLTVLEISGTKIQDSTGYSCDNLINDLKMWNLKDLSFEHYLNFSPGGKGTDGWKSFLSKLPSLERIFVRFKEDTSSRYQVMTDVPFHLPQSLRVLELIDPLIGILPKIQLLTNLQKCRMKFNAHFDFKKYTPSGKKHCELFENFLQTVFLSPHQFKQFYVSFFFKKVKKVRKKGQKVENQSGIIQLRISKALKKVWFYEFIENRKDFDTKLIRVVEKSISKNSMFKMGERGNGKKMQVTNYYIHAASDTRARKWRTLEKKVLPQTLRDIATQDEGTRKKWLQWKESRKRRGKWSRGASVKVNGKWVKYKRKSYSVLE